MVLLFVVLKEKYFTLKDNCNAIGILNYFPSKLVFKKVKIIKYKIFFNILKFLLISMDD